jgi:hypothetical protein
MVARDLHATLRNGLLGTVGNRRRRSGNPTRFPPPVSWAPAHPSLCNCPTHGRGSSSDGGALILVGSGA